MGLAGEWTIGKEHARLSAANGTVVYRFHARDLHLVLGPGVDGKPVRFPLTLGETAPGNDHGVDITAAGEGVIVEQHLYQVVRQQGAVAERTFKIRFLNPGVEVFAFTFG